MSETTLVLLTVWMDRAQILLANRLTEKGLPVVSYGASDDETKSTPRTGAVLRDAITMRTTPPFVASHDILRGIVYAGRSALQFAFMLAIMYVSCLPIFPNTSHADMLSSLCRTYQVGFILSIIVGLGVGETLFGRYIASA